MFESYCAKHGYVNIKTRNAKGGISEQELTDPFAIMIFNHSQGFI